MILIQIDVHWPVIESREIHDVGSSVLIQGVHVDRNVKLHLDGWDMVKCYSFVEINIGVFLKLLFQAFRRFLQGSDT